VPATEISAPPVARKGPIVMDGFPQAVSLSPAEWPDNCRGPRPGDLKLFIPQGFGLGAPPIITPYGGPPQGSYYGFHEQQAHPFLNGPKTESRGGTLYFDDDASTEMLNAALSLMGVYETKDYVAFGASSTEPEDCYLDQLRFVSHAALTAVFGTTTTEPPRPQALNVREAICAFVASQKERWNDGSAFSSKLSGKAGGDGDWAKESLAFGFHVENTYWGIYRIWSRAWLVTK
jgi:hypothetical protein